METIENLPYFVQSLLTNVTGIATLSIIVISIILIVPHIVGTFGRKRKIGYLKAFLAALFLTPIMGMLFVLASDKK